MTESEVSRAATICKHFVTTLDDMKEIPTILKIAGSLRRHYNTLKNAEKDEVEAPDHGDLLCKAKSPGKVITSTDIAGADAKGTVGKSVTPGRSEVMWLENGNSCTRAAAKTAKGAATRWAVIVAPKAEATIKSACQKGKFSAVARLALTSGGKIEIKQIHMTKRPIETFKRIIIQKT